AWEGDADLDGDRVTIDGNTVAPVSGHGTADNAFVSSARGAVGDPFTFGTDVVGFDAVLGRETDVRIRTEQDALLVGVLSLVEPMRKGGHQPAGAPPRDGERVTAGGGGRRIWPKLCRVMDMA